MGTQFNPLHAVIALESKIISLAPEKLMRVTETRGLSTCLEGTVRPNGRVGLSNPEPGKAGLLM